MNEMNETKNAYVVWTNTDLTEGRGTQYPLAICEKEATAYRMAKGQGVQGMDADVQPIELIQSNTAWGRWYGPITLMTPTAEDNAMQVKLDAKRAAVAKAKSAGLTEAEVAALSFPTRL